MQMMIVQSWQQSVAAGIDDSLARHGPHRSADCHDDATLDAKIGAFGKMNLGVLDQHGIRVIAGWGI
jgi:hypothetical protein